jgi:signal transduction histidine kinase
VSVGPGRWWRDHGERVAGFFTRPVRDVRGASLRVALIATGVVLVAYVLIATAVVMIVNRNLTTAVDDRLQGYMSQLLTTGRLPTGSGATLPTEPGHLLQEPLLMWVVLPDGQVGVPNALGQLVAPDMSPAQVPLPASARRATSPTTVELSGGSALRVEGAAVTLGGRDAVVTSAHLVVGQSLVNLAATQHNIVEAEVIVGPILLLAVFFGSLAVGRRVAAPIERARQRQIEMTADASHELRTPLSVIEAQTSLALERDRDPQWYRNAFQAVGVESKRMRRLVDDLLWLARFDSAGPAPSSEATDLGVLAENAAARFTAVAEAHGLTLRIAVDPVSTMINAPPEWLDRLLGVLLDNACRYTPAGGAVEVLVGRRDGRVRLAVDDSGPGIPAEERPHIFDRFRRANDTPGGSGLGLAIAAAVVGSSGGRWEVGTSTAGGASMAVSWTPLIRGGAETEVASHDEVSTGGADPSVSTRGAMGQPAPPHPA